MLSINAVWAENLAQRNDAFDLRKEIFVKEQGFTNEFDLWEDKALHLILYCDTLAIAAARIYAEEKQWHIGRVCVLPSYRKQGLGSVLIRHCVQKAVQLHPDWPILLGAQVQAQHFYAKLGFVPCGPIYYDEHCPHQPMQWQPSGKG